MSKWLPRPVMRIKDVIGGLYYIEVSVAMSGHMSLKITRLNGVPNKRNVVKCLCWENTVDYYGDWTNITYNFAGNIGDHIVNNHRIFLHNMKNLSFLKHLVDNQFLEVYLDLINSKDNVDDLKERGKREMQEMDELWNFYRDNDY
jgi:hypothetical protein